MQTFRLSPHQGQRTNGTMVSSRSPSGSMGPPIMAYGQRSTQQDRPLIDFNNRTLPALPFSDPNDILSSVDYTARVNATQGPQRNYVPASCYEGPTIRLYLSNNEDPY